MTDNLNTLAASFAASKAHRDSRGAYSVQLTVLGSVAALVAATTIGYKPVTDDVKQFDSCIARVELKDPVTGVVQAALGINNSGRLWKDGKLADMAIEKVLAAVKPEHQQAAEKLMEQLGL